MPITGVMQSASTVRDDEALLDEAPQDSLIQAWLLPFAGRLAALERTDEIAVEAAHGLREMCAAEHCDVWAIAEDQARHLAGVGIDDREGEDAAGDRGLPPRHTARAALETNEPIVVGDVETAGLSDMELDSCRRRRYRSKVTLPLVVNSRAIGFVDIFDTRPRDFINHLGLLRDAGRLLAGILGKALRVERLETENRDLSVLVDSALAFGSTLDLAEVLHSMSGRIRDVSGSDVCAVLRNTGGEIETLTCLGEAPEAGAAGRRLLLRENPNLAEAAASRRPALHIAADAEEVDLQRAPATAAPEEFRATLDVPLLAHEELIGFVSLRNREPRAFANQSVVVDLARIAGQALVNAALHQELDHSMRWMMLMSESALELGGSLDLRDTMHTAARRLCAGVGVSACEITVVEGDALRTLMRVEQGRVDEARIGRRLPLAEATVSRDAIETKRAVVAATPQQPRLTPTVRDDGRAIGARNLAILPLLVRNRAIGTVQLEDDDASRTFSQRDLDRAAAICLAAAMAIENAALFEREQAANRETLLLNEIARRTAASLDLEEIVRATTDTLRDFLPFEDYSLLLTSEGRIERVISQAPGREALADVLWEETAEDLLRAMREKSILLLRAPEDIPLLAGHPLLKEPCALVTLALRSDGRIFGILNLMSTARRSFSEADLDLLGRVAAQLSLAVKNARLYEEIREMHLGNLKALSSALNAKDYYTFGHAARVATYTVMLGRQLGWDDDVLGALQEAAYLHDIGKISISDRVLLKPGRLNEHEWRQMREHPVFSADIIRPLFPEPLVKAVRHHHERYDGHGYPDGLAGEEIPLLARVMAVVDAYDAMSCRRPYKAALPYSECLAELRRNRGTQFDPQMVDAFITVLRDVAQRRRLAEVIATMAAGRIRGEAHAALHGREDESTPEYREIRDILREIRDTGPRMRLLTTYVDVGKTQVMGVDVEEREAERSHLGDEIFVDDELPEVLAGRRPRVNTVYANQYGVWIPGLAPIHDSQGSIVAAVAADLPALDNPESEARQGDQRRTFASILKTAAIRLGRAEVESMTDSLTGLYNHRYLHERLGEEIQRARERTEPLSVLFCDLDHFKHYNDTFGHSAGDTVLREVAHVIEQSVRGVDVAARYGGEEFVVVLPDTDRDAALAVGRRVRERLQEVRVAPRQAPPTISIGVASYPQDAESAEDLLDVADRAMYTAKRRGRDQVVASREE